VFDGDQHIGRIMLHTQAAQGRPCFRTITRAPQRPAERGDPRGSDGGFQGAVERIKLMGITVVLVHGADYGDVMLERFGKVCGWAGTGFALLSFILGFHKSSPGNGEPLYVGVLAAVAFFLVGQALRYILAGNKPRTSSRL